MEIFCYFAKLAESLETKLTPGKSMNFVHAVLSLAFKLIIFRLT